MATILLFILCANRLGSLIIFAGDNAVLVDLLADEGWHGLCIVLKTRSGVVGAGAIETQGIL